MSLTFNVETLKEVNEVEELADFNVDQWETHLYKLRESSKHLGSKVSKKIDELESTLKDANYTKIVESLVYKTVDSGGLLEFLRQICDNKIKGPRSLGISVYSAVYSVELDIYEDEHIETITSRSDYLDHISKVLNDHLGEYVFNNYEDIELEVTHVAPNRIHTVEKVEQTLTFKLHIA